MKHYVGGSFRDPSGRVFIKNGHVFREIAQSYAADYQRLISSGLYQQLVDDRQLVPHEETPPVAYDSTEIFKIIKPEYIPFISYPYEWCFSQLQDAALLTLAIQKKSLRFGMSLKDASAYNVQFRGCEPIFIDTLSFEPYQEGRPWTAYRQFCQHFLAPLLLCSLKDMRLSRLLQLFIDGVPLDLTCSLLPWIKRFRPGVFIHVYLHSRYQENYSSQGLGAVKEFDGKRMSQQALEGVIENLESFIRKLSWNASGTEWADYYQQGHNNYTDQSFEAKKRIVNQYIKQVEPRCVWDLGANRGIFSRIAAEKGIATISMDLDPVAVELNYREGREHHDRLILPLVMDLNNPTPAIGWQLNERMSLPERGPADLVIALALIHHLVIGNNVPLEETAKFFANISRHLIIEFVPREDSQVQKMLETREDIFENYNIKHFRESFAKHFHIVDETVIEGSNRTVFLMRLH